MEITLDNTKSAVIPAKIAQEQCKVLVDTGASRCCIREDYFNKIPGTSLSLLKGVRIRSATGRDLQTLGRAECAFTLGGRDYKMEFIVCRNLRRPAILGLDFLRQNRIGTTWTPTGTFALQRGEDILVESIEVCFENTNPMITAYRHYTVPARSIMIVTAKANMQLQDQGRVFEVNATPSFMDKHPSMITLPVLHKTDQETRENVPYLLINLSMEDEEIEKGEELAVMKVCPYQLNEIETEQTDEEEINNIEEDKIFEQCDMFDDKTEVDKKFITSPAQIESQRKVKLQNAPITDEDRSNFEVDPIMIPPPPLRELLAEAEKEMAHNPRLELPYKIDTDIYKYYTVMKITPVVVGDMMAMLLTIPLIDKSLKMNVYKVHNLPALDPELKVASEYVLEGEYLAIDEHGLYVALPDAREIQICLTSQGGLCVMNQALHPIETINWCIYALFIQDQERIKKDCTMSFKPREGNLAQSLGGYLWAVSSLVGEKMQIRCLQETHIEQIKPPLQVIHVGNGCEGYSPSIKIPAKSELTSQNDIVERTNYFLEFNIQYTGITKIGPWDLFQISDWEKQELKDMVAILPTLPPLNYENLNKRIGKLKEYPLKIPVAIIAIVLVVSTLFMVVTLVIIALVICKLRGNLKVLLPIGKIMIGKANSSETNQVRQALRTLLDLTPGHQQPPELPERRKPLELTPEISRSSQKSILPSSTDIQRYEEYLNRKKKEIKKSKQ